MTSEEKREQLLKRILPGLAICIIYFVFISGMMKEKMKTAETAYKTLAMSGISKDALPAISSQQQETQQRLMQMQGKVSELQKQLQGMAGFLAGQSSSANVTMQTVTETLERFQVTLRRIEKQPLPENQLSPALKEVWQALKPKEPAVKPPANPGNPQNSGVFVHHLWLKGAYLDMYQALNALATSKLSILPVTLTMQMPDTATEKPDEMEWELILWM